METKSIKQNPFKNVWFRYLSIADELFNTTWSIPWKDCYFVHSVSLHRYKIFKVWNILIWPIANYILKWIQLFLVNTLNDVSEKSPRPKTDVVALVSWVQVCLYYIGAAMIEYTFLLASNIVISHLDKGSYCGRGLKLITQHLDKLIFLFFPVIFAITSYLFWKPLITS